LRVRVADRHVVAAIVVLLEDGQYPLGRESVNSRDHRCVHQSAIGEKQEIEAVVDQIELVRSLEHR
jgi:hypothetical protein